MVHTDKGLHHNCLTGCAVTYNNYRRGSRNFVKVKMEQSMEQKCELINFRETLEQLMRTRNAIILRIRINRKTLEWMKIKLIRYNITLKDEEVALV